MNIFGRITRRLKRVVYGPRVTAIESLTLISFGSSYGRWTFVDRPSLHGGMILSCGLGEDASFDIEAARHFGATILMVDPTPRAVAHFEAFLSRVGEAAESSYVGGGLQPVTAYDLRGVSRTQFKLVPKALAPHSGKVRFYKPRDPRAVSHSIVNFQNNYSTLTPYIEVPAVDFASLAADLGLDNIALAKFDIEGAEIAVIPQMLLAGLHPEQVLVEFDELNWPSKLARRNFESVHEQLTNSGYVVSYFDQRSCVSYLWKPSES